MLIDSGKRGLQAASNDAADTWVLYAPYSLARVPESHWDFLEQSPGIKLIAQRIHVDAAAGSVPLLAGDPHVVTEGDDLLRYPDYTLAAMPDGTAWVFWSNERTLWARHIGGGLNESAVELENATRFQPISSSAELSRVVVEPVGFLSSMHAAVDGAGNILLLGHVKYNLRSDSGRQRFQHMSLLAEIRMRDGQWQPMRLVNRVAPLEGWRDSDHHLVVASNEDEAVVARATRRIADRPSKDRNANEVYTLWVSRTKIDGTDWEEWRRLSPLSDTEGRRAASELALPESVASHSESAASSSAIILSEGTTFAGVQPFYIDVDINRNGTAAVAWTQNFYPNKVARDCIERSSSERRQAVVMAALWRPEEEIDLRDAVTPDSVSSYEADGSPQIAISNEEDLFVISTQHREGVDGPSSATISQRTRIDDSWTTSPLYEGWRSLPKPSVLRLSGDDLTVSWTEGAGAVSVVDFTLSSDGVGWTRAGETQLRLGVEHFDPGILASVGGSTPMIVARVYDERVALDFSTRWANVFYSYRLPPSMLSADLD